MRKLTYASFFSGIDGIRAALDSAGFECVHSCEIDEFCRKVLKARYGEEPKGRDIREETADTVPDADLFVGGWPCFQGGTLVLTRAGLVPVEKVRIGDEVLTHLCRWRKVLRTMSRVHPTIQVRGQGHGGIVTTEEHPFYAARMSPKWDNERRSNVRVFSEPEWIEAKDLAGCFWASHSTYPPSTPPPLELVGNESVSPVMGDGFFRFVGLYLADGWVDIDGRRGSVVLGVGKAKASKVSAMLDSANMSFTISEERTTTRFVVHGRAVARWVRDNFGVYCDGKTVPAWALGMDAPLRSALLEGYLSGDGYRIEKRGIWKVNSVSRALSVGVRMLAQSLGYSVSHGVVKNSRDNVVIEGRTVSERPYHATMIFDKSRSSVEIGGLRLGLVRSVTATGSEERVFNLEVEEDNSYTADGLIVHNCQGLSMAGLRKGLSDDRSGLFWELVRLLEQKRPRWFAFENVPGLLSTCSCARCGRQCKACRAPAGADDGECQVCGGENLGGRVLPEHRGTDFFVVLTALQKVGYSVETRILDAQFLGVPQRRSRIFLVGRLGACCPPEILFEPQERGRDPEEGGEAGKEGPMGPGGGAQVDRRTADARATPDGAPRAGSRNGAGERITCVSNASAPTTGKPSLTKSPSGSGRISVMKPESTSEKAHAVSKGTGGGLGGRDGQDDYVIQPAPTAFHRNASCSVTPQGDKGAALKGEGEHSCQFVAAPLTAGSSPNSNTPGRKREDDENLVIVEGSPEDVAFDAHNVPKTKTGTLTGGDKGGGKNEINLPMVARGVGLEQEEEAPAPPKDAPGQALLFPGQDLGRRPPEAYDGKTRVLRLGNASTSPFVKSDVTDALDTGSGHGAGYASQGVMTICMGSDPISSVDVAQPVTGRRGDPGTVAVPPLVSQHRSGDNAPLAVVPKTSVLEGDSASSTPALPSLRTGRGLSHVAVQEDNQNGVCLSPKAGSLRADAPGHQPGGSLIFGSTPQGALDQKGDRGDPREVVAFQESQSGCREDDVHASLDANFGPRRHEGVFTPMTVRRLTPTEAERLQGLADGWTCLCQVGLDCPNRRIPPWLDPSTFKLGGCGHSACGCECTDSNRYRSLGNSVAVPVICWIARRLKVAMEKQAGR